MCTFIAIAEEAGFGFLASFVVSFVVAMNKVDVIAVNSIGQVVLTAARTDGYVKSI